MRLSDLVRKFYSLSYLLVNTCCRVHTSQPSTVLFVVAATIIVTLLAFILSYYSHFQSIKPLTSCVLGLNINSFLLCRKQECKVQILNKEK